MRATINIVVPIAIGTHLYGLFFNHLCPVVSVVSLREIKIMVIDSHIHFWNYHPVKDAWITDDMQVIQRSFLPEDIAPLLLQNNVDGCIAVQADQSEQETEFLVSLAQKNHFIKGVVGWVDLRADNIEKRLDFYSTENIIKGWRHIVQAEPTGFLHDKKFLHGISLLAKYSYTYDLLIYPPQLDEALLFVQQFPKQAIVIDHCSKPDIKNNNIAQWAVKIKELAEHENVYCKLSGLITEAAWNNWTEQQMFDILDTVFEAFGVNRLMFGSDWPVINLSGNYGQWKNCLEKYLTQFSEEERIKVMAGNCMEFYSIGSSI